MSRPLSLAFLWATLWCTLWATSTPVAEGAGPAAPVDYVKQVKPLLATKCYSCHGALKQEGGLRLETKTLMLAGGESGPVLAPSAAEQSLLLKRITAGEDERMPPAEEGGSLTADEVAMLRDWIEQGAVAPDEEAPAAPQDHWAFQKPVRAPLPATAAATGNPIDAFLSAKRESLGLVAVARAEPEVLLRRLNLDLAGLPPSRQQLRAFLAADDTDQAYEQIVDELLDSPRYGERWGRHWMDIWRYSDWSGYRNEVRNSHRHIWRWRDWIIQSLNEDKPYDRMIQEMLAGDELAPTDPDTLRATGFLARNWYLFNRDVWLDATVEHTSKAFLGLTMNCAKCHDHKYDPIPQVDYYRLRAFFEPHQVRIDSVPGVTDLDKNGLARVFDASPDAPTYLHIRGNPDQPDQSQAIAPGVPEVVAAGELTVSPVTLPPEAYHPALRPFVLQDYLAAAEQEIGKAKAALDKARAAQQAKPEDQPLQLATVVAEKNLAAAELHPELLRLAHAADLAKHGSPAATAEQQEAAIAAAAQAARHRELAVAEAELARAEQQLAAADEKGKAKAEQGLKTAKAQADKALNAGESPGDNYPSLHASLQSKQSYNESDASRHAPYAKVSTGRRTALARWITHRDNPLTARVAVNHIWLRHFGAPLVESVFDFGLRAERPRHAELLDWLAVELMESGWSMKHLHRLIVTSQAYRLQSGSLGAAPANFEIDPDNQYLWRMNSRRLEAEAVRDSILHVAGELDATAGGPEIDYRSGQTNKRRSMYFQTAYEKQMKFLVIFDEASVNECYRRAESVVPHHALALSNSALSYDQSRLLAGKLSAELATEQPSQQSAASGDVPAEAFIRLAFEHVLSRSPTSAETKACLAFLGDQAKRLGDPKQLTPFVGNGGGKVQPAAEPTARARENLVHVLLNHNDFVTIR
ncbi:MAG: DUF1553 domain-containing protein [Planctomycetales bacterium]|nr:DUF1553 domain-containing protein [Planctomycetales bacterium]